MNRRERLSLFVGFVVLALAALPDVMLLDSVMSLALPRWTLTTLFAFSHYRLILVGGALSALLLLATWDGEELSARWLEALSLFAAAIILWFLLNPRNRWNFPEVPWLFVGLIFGIWLIHYLLARLPERQVGADTSLTAAERLGLVNDYRRTNAQLLGGALVVFGLFASWQQLNISSSGAALATREYATERIDRALELIRSDNAATVSSTIAELGKLANDLPEFRCRVESILGAIIVEARGGASESSQSAIRQADTGTHHLRADQVQLALAQFRGVSGCHAMNFAGLDLSGLNLGRTDLSGADLRNVKFDGTRFDRVTLYNADLRGASFVGAELSETNLRGDTGLVPQQLVDATVNDWHYIPRELASPR